MSTLDAKFEFIERGKQTATAAIELDVSGSTAEAMQLYEDTCSFLRSGLELETEPDAILTLQGKLASFERRIAELEQTLNEDINISSSVAEDDDDDDNYDDDDGPAPTWSDEPAEPSRRNCVEDNADVEHDELPSSQLRSSQEELRVLMRSKDQLESQIADARERAETYTKSLEEARRSEERIGGVVGHGPTVESRDMTANLEEDSSIVSASTNNTNVAVVHDGHDNTIRRRRDTSGLADRAAALERVVKVQQREIIVANTDLRVSKARCAALQQKLAEMMDPKENTDVTRQMNLAETFVEQIKERMRECDTSKAEALALNRALVEKLNASQTEVLKLQNTVAQLHTISQATDEEDMALPPPPPSGGDTDGLSSASSISTFTEVYAQSTEPTAVASHAIMRQWRQQARDNIAKAEISDSPSDSFEETKGLLREGYSLAESLGLGSRKAGEQSSDILMGNNEATASKSKTSSGTKGKPRSKTSEGSTGPMPRPSTPSRSSSMKSSSTSGATTRPTSAAPSRTIVATARQQTVASRLNANAMPSVRRPTSAPIERKSMTKSYSVSNSNVGISSSMRRSVKVVVPSGRQTQNAGTSAVPRRKAAGNATSSIQRSVPQNERSVRSASSGSIQGRTRTPLSTPRARASAAAVALDLSLDSMGRGAMKVKKRS
jgi:hypothetical protein